MKSLLKYTMAIWLITITQQVFAQYESNFTQYMFNPLLYNPAYAGNNDQGSITFINRAQWTGISGAPYAAALSAHSKTFEEELGLGLSVLHDRLGIETATSISLDVSYHILLGVHKQLAFGLRGSAFSYNTTPGDLSNAQQDPLLQGDISVFSGNVGTGVFLYAKNYYIGLSAPSLLTPRLTQEGIVSQNDKSQNFYFASGYVFDLNSDLKLKPSILVKNSMDNVSPVVDVNINMLIKELFWIGGLFRSTEEIGLMLSTHKIKNTTIGYSFEYPLSNINTNGIFGSHEIMVTLGLRGRKTKFSSPRYY